MWLSGSWRYPPPSSHPTAGQQQQHLTPRCMNAMLPINHMRHCVPRPRICVDGLTTQLKLPLHGLLDTPLQASLIPTAQC